MPVNFSDITEDSFSPEELALVKKKAFSPELKGLIDKVSRPASDLPKEKPQRIIEDQLLFDLHSFFYQALNLKYAGVREAERETAHAASTIFFYNLEKKCYLAGSVPQFQKIYLNPVVYRKIRTENHLTVGVETQSGVEDIPVINLLERFNLKSVLEADSIMSLFPPLAPEHAVPSEASFISEASSMFGKTEVLPFIHSTQHLIELSKLHNHSLLISYPENESESLPLLARLKHRINTLFPAAFCFIAGSGSAILFCFDEDLEPISNLISGEVSVTAKTLRNFSSDIISLYQ